MSQINSPITNTFQAPPASNYRGIGFDGSGHPVRINADGSTTRIALEDAGGLSPNIIANRGIGLAADLPTTFVAGDIYIANDTFLIYTATSTINWSSVPLVSSQFVTSETALYQYNGTDLILLTSPPNRREIISLSSGVSQKVPFTDGTLGSVNYTLFMTAYDVDGLPIYPVRGVKEEDGFNIQVDFDCTLEFEAKLNL